MTDEQVREQIEGELSQYGSTLLGWKSWGLNSVDRMHSLKIESAKEILSILKKDGWVQLREGEHISGAGSVNIKEANNAE